MQKFEANVGKLLHLLSHSVYTNKEVFIRELTSNAIDACEKLRFLITSGQIENIKEIKDDNFKIQIEIDKNNKKIIFRDNGIGFTKEELINNLGTIANSGTEVFLQKIKENQNNQTNLIGQFGIGFYSSFVVSTNVEVITKSAKEKEQKTYLWKSDGIEGFEVKEIEPLNNNFNTQITLHLKDEYVEEFDKFRIENIVKTYLNFSQVSIEILEDNKTEIISGEKKPLWLRNKNDISQEEYFNFFKNITYTIKEPLKILHKNIEGKFNFDILLSIPSEKPFRLYNPDRNAEDIKIYVKNVLISEKIEVIPKYLRFVNGIIASDDLSLNISRESVQNDSKIIFIKNKITEYLLKLIEEIKDKEPEKYIEFWNNFGPVLKEGLCEGLANRDKLLSLLKFKTTKSENNFTSFDEYISRMKENQKEIFYIIGEKYEEIINSHHIERFKKDNIEVILFTDDVDGFWVNLVSDVKTFDFKSVTSYQDLKDEEDKNKEESTENRKIIEKFSEILKNKVLKVEISNKLIDSPVCLSNSAGGMDPIMEKILIAQKQKEKPSLRILEINPNSILIKKANELLQSTEEKEQTKGKDLVLSLFDLANINFGTDIENKALFSNRIYSLIASNL